MLSRLREVADDTEVHAFEAINRCCSEAYADYTAACNDIDRHRAQALRAALNNDYTAAIEYTRRESRAEDRRRTAWHAQRVAFAVLLTLTRRTADELSPTHTAVARAG